MIYGYARVSTADQNLDRQKDALQKFGVERLYCEKMSGTKKNRPELDRMLAEIQCFSAEEMTPKCLGCMA